MRLRFVRFDCHLVIGALSFRLIRQAHCRNRCRIILTATVISHRISDVLGEQMENRNEQRLRLQLCFVCFLQFG